MNKLFAVQLTAKKGSRDLHAVQTASEQNLTPEFIHTVGRHKSHEKING